MATWQFDLYLIPRQKLLSLFGEVPSTLDDEAFESVRWCKDAPLPANYEEVLSSFLPEGVSWCDEARMWGEEDGNRIELFDVSGDTEISVRVDARTRNEQVLNGIIKFARFIDAVLLTEEDKVIEPDVNVVIRELEESNASRFVRDPYGFFESIANGEIKFND
jgi:hypothetical protein